MVDSRIALLAQEMGSPWPDDQSWKRFRQRIVALHGDVSSEEDRLILMDMHKTLTDLAERQSQDDPERLKQFIDANEAQYRVFLLVEAEKPDGGLDLVKYGLIADREVAMGRLDPESDTYKIAKSGAQVLAPRTSQSLRSLIKKIFRS